MFRNSGHFDGCPTNWMFWPGESLWGAANLLVADGHEEKGRWTHWLSVGNRHRWNTDGQPHPETWGRE